MSVFSDIFNKKKKPIVVAALQSPHLLNIWKDSHEWRLFYALLGDHDGLEESKELEVESYADSNIKPSEVSAVLVTSPLQLERSKKHFPKAKVFWVVHTGVFLEVLPSEHAYKLDGIVTLTKAVMELQLKHKPALKKLSNFIITPYFDANKIWRWQEGMLWTIRSRVAERADITRKRLEYVMSGIGDSLMRNDKLLFFGSGSPDGYIDKIGKYKMSASSSGYISALPKDAGFGLAEHEALAYGVPIVGSRWGDMEHEMPKTYKCLVDDEDKMIKYALRLSRDREFAEKMSEIGLEYIRKYRSLESMNNQVRVFSNFIKK